VSDHWGIEENEITDQLARTGSEHPFIEPVPAYGMSETTCQVSHQKALRTDTNTKTGSPHVDKNMQSFLQGPSQERLETVTCKQESIETCHGTVYHHLKGTLGLPNSTKVTIPKIKHPAKSLCDCEGATDLTLCNLGLPFTKASKGNIVSFEEGTNRLNLENRCITNDRQSWCKGWYGLPPLI
jgi:hypothetical protein